MVLSSCNPHRHHLFIKYAEALKLLQTVRGCLTHDDGGVITWGAAAAQVIGDDPDHIDLSTQQVTPGTYSRIGGACEGVA